MAAQNRNTKGLPPQVNLTAESMLFYYFPITLLRGQGRSAVRLKADVTDLLSACAPDRWEQEGHQKEGSSFDNRKERTLSQTKRNHVFAGSQLSKGKKAIDRRSQALSFT